MDPFAFFFFENSFCFAHVNQRLNVDAVTVLFLLMSVFCYLVLATRAIEECLKRIGDERHDREERTDNGQQKKQSGFGIARRDEEWDQLTKNTCEKQSSHEADKNEPRI